MFKKSFDIDMDIDESPKTLQLQQVGKGVIKNKKNNQFNNIAFLTNHPVSPFKGECYKWSSLKYDDGSIYEGLTLENLPHNKGTFILGNISSGGLKRVSNYDRYEGETHCGFAHGIGAWFSPFISEIYLGEFVFGWKQGCGMLITLKPLISLINKGLSYNKAMSFSKKLISKKTKIGLFRRDQYKVRKNFIPLMSRREFYCSANEIKGTLCELKNILTKVRMFQYKPGSFVYKDKYSNFSFISFQDPHNFPFNTTFLAPGPIGQCFSVPNYSNILKEMSKISKNYNFLEKQYNLRY